MITVLTPMERKVLNYLDNQNLSISDTAKTLHMESMRVAQIERKARRKLDKTESI